MAKIQLKRYLHSCKEDNYDAILNALEGSDITMSGEALRNFSYALYEVEFTLEVDTETGNYTIVDIKP